MSNNRSQEVDRVMIGRWEDAKAMLEQYQQKILHTGVHLQELTDGWSRDGLTHAQLMQAINWYDGVVELQERVIELRELKPVIERCLEADRADRDARELNDQLMFLPAVLIFYQMFLFPHLHRAADAMGLDPTPLLFVEDHLTMESRAAASALVRRMRIIAERPERVGSVLQRRVAGTVSAALEQAADRRLTRKDRRVKWLAEAMLLVQDHPYWPDSTIAQRAGVDKSRLSRTKAYQAAASLARSQATTPGKNLPVNDAHRGDGVDDSFDVNRRGSKQSKAEEEFDARIDREMRATQRGTQRNTRADIGKRRAGDQK